MTIFRDAALKLGSRRLRVFPCWPRTKKPRFENNLKLATIEPVIIRRWWSDARDDSNVAIATGRGSGIWVTDEDGEEGLATMSRLEAEHGKLPKTVEVVTGGGGRHLYWRWPANGVEIRNFQCRDDLPGFDVRGEGGYVMAPPSVHPDGPIYAWSVDSADHFADAPEWLIQLVTERSARSGNGQAVAPTLPAAWQAVMEREHEGSRRAAAVAKIFGHLVRKFVDPAIAIALVELFDRGHNKDPLGRDEVIRICADIAERETARRDGGGTISPTTKTAADRTTIRSTSCGRPI